MVSVMAPCSAMPAFQPSSSASSSSRYLDNYTAFQPAFYAPSYNNYAYYQTPDPFKWNEGKIRGCVNNNVQSNDKKETKSGKIAIRPKVKAEKKVLDPSKGEGGPPVVRYPSSDVTKALFVDCSVEYELPNVPKVPKDSQPLLVIHPGYQPKTSSFRIPRGDGVVNRRYQSGCMQCDRLNRKRDASRISAADDNSNYGADTTTRLINPSASGCYVQQQPPQQQQQQQPAKRSRTTGPQDDWLQQRRRLCEQQQKMRVTRSSYNQMQLWPPHSWIHPATTAKVTAPPASWTRCDERCRQQMQQQLYVKQQQAAYFRQRQMLNRNSDNNNTACPGCLNGKCLFVWNKENLASIRYR